MEDKDLGLADPELEKIQAAVTRRHGDSVATNRLLRSVHRAKAPTSLHEGLGIPLLPQSKTDDSEAEEAMKATKVKKLQAANPTHKLAKTLEGIRRQRNSSSIFGNTTPSDPKQKKLMKKLESMRPKG